MRVEIPIQYKCTQLDNNRRRTTSLCVALKRRYFCLFRPETLVACYKKLLSIQIKNTNLKHKKKELNNKERNTYSNVESSLNQSLTTMADGSRCVGGGEGSAVAFYISHLIIF